jgi:hypothetical protein
MPNSQRLPASRFQIVPFACTLVLSAGLICAGSIESFAQGPCEIMDPTGTPLNVRASPNGHIVGTLQNGVQVSVVDRAVGRKKQTWVYVRHSENQSPIGWVYREFIACKSDGTASQNAGVEQSHINEVRLDVRATAAVAKMPTSLTCIGVLVHDDSGYRLKPDTGSSSWCDAEISNEYGQEGSVSQILSACKVGGGTAKLPLAQSSRCEIKGIVNGHGAFYWVKLSSVRSIHALEKVQPGDSIGWVKSSDIECEEDNTCGLKDNYTDAGKNGGICAVFGIPVYNRPNGTPIAELVSEMAVEGVVRGEQHHGYTFVTTLPDYHAADVTLPYDPKNLNQCG